MNMYMLYDAAGLELFRSSNPLEVLAVGLDHLADGRGIKVLVGVSS